MATIKELAQNAEKTAPIIEENSIYSPETLENAAAADLMEKQNGFSAFLEKLETEMKEKPAREILKSVPEMTQTLRKYAENAAASFRTEDEKTLFLRWAESSGSKALAKMKAFAENAAESYKINGAKAYCGFLIKNSRDLYDDPAELAENAAYCEGYMKLIPGFPGRDAEKAAVKAVYGAAIEGAIKNGAFGAARAYLNMKKIASTFTEREMEGYLSTLAREEDEALIKTLAIRLRPQNDKELEENLAALKKAGEKGYIKPETAAEAAARIEITFQSFKKIQRLNSDKAALETALELIIKILSSEISPEETASPALPPETREVIAKALKTDNKSDSPGGRKKTSESLEKVLKAVGEGKAASLRDIVRLPASAGLDCPGLLAVLKTLKKNAFEKIYGEPKI